MIIILIIFLIILIRRKKRVLDGIEHPRFIISNYTPDYRKFGDDIDIINYKIINKYDFDPEFQLSPLTSPP